MKALCGIYFAVEAACETVVETVQSVVAEVGSIVMRSISPR